MNFHMISKCGEGSGLLQRIAQEGNEVSLQILEDDYSSVYNGLLRKTEYPQDGDIIIYDSSGNGVRADKYRKQGFKVFGASSFADKLEHDRGFGLDFMRSHGISIPETKTFTDFGKGIEFIKANKDKRFVFKPSGELPCKLTYSCSDAKDLILYMKYVEENFDREIEDFVLQEFIEGSIISSEYWVGPRGFIEPINHTIEVKKLMNEDLGPSTGCSGNLVWVGEDSSILSELLRNTEKTLVQEGFIGPIDLNAIVTENNIFGLEWTPRFGLDAMPTLLQLLSDCEVGELISDICQGIKVKMNLIDAYAGGVRLTIPPYPIEPKSLKSIEKDSPNRGIPIRGYEGSEEFIYFYEVEKRDDLLFHSAGTGLIGVVSDISEGIEECFDVPYEILDNMKVPDKQYRTDLREILPQMQREVMEVLDEVRA